MFTCIVIIQATILYTHAKHYKYERKSYNIKRKNQKKKKQIFMNLTYIACLNH